MNRTRFPAGLLACLALTSRASAEPAADLQALLAESVVSTASKSSERASEAPGTTSVVTAEDIRRLGLRSLNEVINYASLGMITSNPLHSVEIGARGVLLSSDYGNHVLLLIDGHPVNEPWNGTAYFDRGLGLPFELIDHIEFVLGPGSVLYGSQAMLGVINVVTKRARDYHGVHLVSEGELATADFDSSDFGSAQRAAVGVGWEFRLQDKPAELTVELEYYRQNGPIFSFGPQVYGNDSVTKLPKRWSKAASGTGVWGGRAENSYYSQVPAAYAKFVLGDLRISARGSVYERATPYLDTLVFSVGDFNQPDNRELDRFLSLDVEHTLTLSSVAQLRSRLYGDLYDYHWTDISSAPEDCAEQQLQGCRRALTAAAHWAGAELQLNLDWLNDSRLTTLLGANARTRHVRSTFDILDRLTLSSGTGSHDYDRVDHNGAAYIQQTARPTEWLGLNAGARADIDPVFGVRISPRAAASFFLWPGETLKFMYSEAFRAPSPYELEYTDPQNQPPARSLSPETVRSLELSTEQRFGTQRILIGAFHSWWRDLVLADGLSDVQVAAAVEAGELLPDVSEAYRYRNASQIENYGFNAALEGSWLLRKLQYGLNLTSAYSRYDMPGSPSQPLTVTPQFFANARLSYEFAHPLPTLGLAAQFLDRRPADRAFDGGHSPTPFAPRHLQLRGSVSGHLPNLEDLSYRLIVDYAFASRGPYAIGPGAFSYSEQPMPAELSPVERMRLIVGFEYVLSP